ncbi:hypothetical protein [Castellaniella sp.]|uniref:hypothetical protein n=1 Tax=Castellaniella sp. TaxID=1955812 RepID=UPI002AFE1D52|nr:hypothetical protein [Castellaniella sp.]
MTINTETIRDAAEVLDTLTSTLAVDHPLRTQAAARAKSCVSGLYSAADALDAQTAEIARLREALTSQKGAAIKCMRETLDEETREAMQAAGIISQAYGYGVGCAAILEADMDEAVRAALSGESNG